MTEFRRMIGWFTLALLFGWTGLSIFGAFLGAELGKSLFNSWPLAVFWFALAVTFAAGFIAFAKLRRFPGLLGMHLGMLLVILGFMANSEAGHRFAARWRGGVAKTTWSYLRLEEGQTSSTLRDQTLRREVGSLPFEVRLDRFEIEHYPLPADPPPLLYGVLAPEPGTPHFSWKTVSLPWKPGRPAKLGDTPVTFRVLEFNHAAEDAPLSVTVELSAAGKTHRHELVCPPGEPFTRVALHPMFPGLAGMHGSASLLLARPAPPVRTYRSRIAITRDGREEAAEVLVNRPVHVAGYHLYQQSWGSEPEIYTVLLVVSDSGVWFVYAGFILLGIGSVWQFWVRPLLRNPAEEEAVA